MSIERGLRIEDLENFEQYWAHRPLNAIRRMNNWPDTTPEAMAEKIKSYKPPPIDWEKQIPDAARERMKWR